MAQVGLILNGRIPQNYKERNSLIILRKLFKFKAQFSWELICGQGLGCGSNSSLVDTSCSENSLLSIESQGSGLGVEQLSLQILSEDPDM